MQKIVVVAICALGISGCFTTGMFRAQTSEQIGKQVSVSGFDPDERVIYTTPRSSSSWSQPSWLISQKEGVGTEKDTPLQKELAQGNNPTKKQAKTKPRQGYYAYLVKVASLCNYTRSEAERIKQKIPILKSAAVYFDSEKNCYPIVSSVEDNLEAAEKKRIELNTSPGGISFEIVPFTSSYQLQFADDGYTDPSALADVEQEEVSGSSRTILRHLAFVEIHADMQSAQNEILSLQRENDDLPFELLELGSGKVVIFLGKKDKSPEKVQAFVKKMNTYLAEQGRDLRVTYRQAKEVVHE